MSARRKAKRAAGWVSWVLLLAGICWVTISFCTSDLPGRDLGERTLPFLGWAAAILLSPAAWHALRRWRASVHVQARRRATGARFLCPECLCFGPFRYACPHCGEEVDASFAEAGREANECPECEKDVPGHAVLAYCDLCQAGVNRRLFHERPVLAVGVLAGADADALSPRKARWSRDLWGTHFRLVEGGVLRYVVDLSSLTDGGRPLPQGHAAGALDAIWVGRAAAADPLALASTLERLARVTGRADAGQLDVPVYVEPGAADPVRRVLDGRFSHIHWDAAPEDALGLAPADEPEWQEAGHWGLEAPPTAAPPERERQ